VEQHRLPAENPLKVSPLADWTWGQVWEYTAGRASATCHNTICCLSIGSQPCKTIPDDPRNPRSGRWSGKKLECGIHTFSERSQ
jgi:phosphoadenosine phosphosulfate reductase